MIKQIRTSALALSALLMMSCAGENTAQGDKNTEEFDTRGLTEFSTAPSSKLTSAKSGLPWQEDEIETRTTGEYTGSGIDFYWTTDDILWIHTDDDVLNPLKKSKRSNIATLSAADTKNRTATAKFYFDGSFTKSSYTVRYTGKNSTSGDKVTIQAQQSQAEPNVASQLGESGDCGIATATMNTGRYEFTLRHQAAYLTFIPYNAPGDISTAAKLVKIKVTANKPLAGEYNFSDTGLDLATSPANPSNTIELSVGGSTGYTLPTAAASDKSFTMVLAPGTYSSFKVEYIFKNQDDNTEISTTREYTNLTFNAGKNTVLGKDFDIRVYHPKYTTWDAVNDYWYNVPNPPTKNGEDNPNYPKGKSDPSNRWANEFAHATIGTPYAAINLCKKCPNANELLWYAFKGDPREDTEKLWIVSGKLNKGGVWFKKQSQIILDEHVSLSTIQSGYDLGNGYKDFRAEEKFDNGDTYVEKNGLHYPPTDTSKYFFLPYFGNHGSGKLLNRGIAAYYWSSTANAFDNPVMLSSPTGDGRAFGLGIYQGNVQVYSNFARGINNMIVWPYD